MVDHLVDLTALVNNLNDVYFIRWMKKAQKAALIEWRDRKTAPGLAARFEGENKKFYEFSDRNSFYEKKKSFLPDFVYTGFLRDQMRSRRAHSAKSPVGGIVKTTMSFGGLSLNTMMSKYGTTSISITSSRELVKVKNYMRSRNGGSVKVIGYTQTRPVSHRVETKAAESYGAQFGKFAKDAPWIQNRTSEIFINIFRKAGLDKDGKLRDRVTLKEI